MSTRFKPESFSNYGIQPLPTGLETTNGPADLSIPSCGVEDVDVALFDLFDKEIVPECSGKGSDGVTKVPIVFAAGEKWSMLKNGRPLRDRNNTLVLPIITIMRSELSQTPEDVTGRGINQQVGEIVIRRRLDKTDRGYQDLINKYLLQNQRNVAVPPGTDTVPGQVTSSRKTGSLLGSETKTKKAYLHPENGDNVVETLVVPTPHFYTAKYQVTIWTQYTQHANQIVEKIMSSMLPQAQSWRLTTSKGYWFVAKLEDGNFATESSFEDMSATERFIKQTFNVSVPAYFFATSAPGVPVPVKRYVSSPMISFDVFPVGEVGEEIAVSEYELGSDDPTLPFVDTKSAYYGKLFGAAQKNNTSISGGSTTGGVNPYATPTSTLPRGYEPKVLSKSPNGETVYSRGTGGFEIVVTRRIK